MLTRRRFVNVTALCAAAMAARPLVAAESGETVPLDQLQSFGVGVKRAEGVVVDKDGFVYAAGRDRFIYRVDPDGTVGTFTQLPEGSIPNGLSMDRNGDVIVCDLGRRAVLRVTMTGKVSVLADEAGGLKLAAPNFSTFDADGNLYVSISSMGGLEQALQELVTPQPNGALVRIRKNGKTDLVTRGIYLANGTAIGPSEDAIYVAETARRNIVRVPIRRDGSFGKAEVFASGFPGAPDGMAFDREGTMFVTLPLVMRGKDRAPFNRILKVDTVGTWSTFLDDSSGTKLFNPTNCAFGGEGLRTLYFASLHGDAMAKIVMPVAGHPLYHQRG